MIAATAGITLVSVLGAAAPAQASTHRPCKVVKHSSTSGVVETAGGKAKLVADGVQLTTQPGEVNDKVSWKTSFSPVLASSVQEVTYETVKLDKKGVGVNDAALPAYHLYVRTPKGDGVLIYEPYYYLMDIGGGNPQRQLRTEWNVLDGKLWTSSANTIEGIDKTAGGPATLTFAEVVTKNPKMTVTGIGFGLGTYNEGTVSILDEQRFATKASCAEHQWSTGFKNNIWWPWSW